MPESTKPNRIALLPWHIEDFFSCSKLPKGSVKPPVRIDCAISKSPDIEEVDHMGQPSVFADLEIEPSRP